MTHIPKLFLLSSKAKQDKTLLASLCTHLAPFNTLTYWHEDMLPVGSNKAVEIQKQLEEADVVVALLSSDYFASKDCCHWHKKAKEMGKYIIPVLLRPCQYKHNTLVKGMLVVPDKPINSWKNTDDAMLLVVNSILKVLKTLPPPPIKAIEEEEELTTKIQEKEEVNTRKVPFSKRPQNKYQNMNSEYFENGYALLIGVGGNLPASVRDAQALYKLLTDKKKAAFNPKNIELLTKDKATKQGILDALERLRNKVSNNNEASVIISYSGHGAFDKHNNVYFLQPHGFSWYYQNETQLLGTDFTNAVNSIPAKKKLVILDCCHAGGFRDGHDYANNSKLVQQLEKGKGTVVIAACQDDEKALDLERLQLDNYGLFTEILLKALSTPPERTNNNGFIYFTDIIAYFNTHFKNRLEKVRPNDEYQQNPIISNLEQFSLSEPFVVCAYDMDIVRGGGGGENVGDLTKKNNHTPPTQLTRQDYYDLIDTDMDSAFGELDKLNWGNRRGTYNDLKSEWTDPPMGFNRTNFRSRLKTLVKFVVV